MEVPIWFSYDKKQDTDVVPENILTPTTEGIEILEK